MSVIPIDQGKWVQTFTGMVNLAAGIYPYRVVILDTSGTWSDFSPVRYVNYPTITIVAGERIAGICVGPVSCLPSSGSTAAIQLIPQNHDCLIVDVGTAPAQCDTTVTGTNINVGDLVSTSETASCYGMVHKTPLTGNAPSANSHIIGRALNKAATNSQFVLIEIEIQEA